MSSRWLQLRLPKVSAIWRVNRERRSGRLSTTGGVSCRERNSTFRDLVNARQLGQAIASLALRNCLTNSTRSLF